MAIQARELRAWLDTISDDEVIAIDDGGMTLLVVGDLDTSLEIGGDPDECENGRSALE